MAKLTRGCLPTGADVNISAAGYLYVALNLDVSCESMAKRIVIITGVNELVTADELQYFISAQARVPVSRLFFSVDGKYAVPLFTAVPGKL